MVNDMPKEYKKFKVYYFIGDYWSGKEEKRRSIIIRARSESEAEKIFKERDGHYSFGWVEEDSK